MKTFREYLTESPKTDVQNAMAYLSGYNDGENRKSPAPRIGGQPTNTKAGVYYYELGHHDGRKGKFGISAPNLKDKILDKAEQELGEELISEANVDTSPYVNAHGSNPKGRGLWIFSTSKDSVDNAFEFTGPFAQAKKEALKHFKKADRSVSTVYLLS